MPTDWNARKMEAFDRALELFKGGKPFVDDLRTAARCELEAYRSSGFVEAVRVIAAGDSCPACRAMNGQILPLEEALASSPLPVHGCTHKMGRRTGWCRCTFVAVVPDP